MTDPPKSFLLSPEIHAYVVEHGSEPDAVLAGLVAATKRLGGIAAMQIAPEQAAFMTLLARATRARRAVEVGTFTGLSALCLARGLSDDGVLIACDVSDEWTAIGRPYWEKAGVAHKIDLRIGPAADTLATLPREETLDISFIDADKEGYLRYYEELIGRTRPNGLIVVDNVLWGGSVIDPNARDSSTAAIRRFNDFVAGDPRVDCVMLPLADGLTLLRKR